MFSKIVILITFLSVIQETEASKKDVLPNVKEVPCTDGIHSCRDGTQRCYRHGVAVSCYPVTHVCCGSGRHCCLRQYSLCCTGELVCCSHDHKCCAEGASAFCCPKLSRCDEPNRSCIPFGRENATLWQFMSRTKAVNAEEVTLTEEAWPAGIH